MATTVSNATILGHNANATVDNGVALGSNSLANVDYGVAGYDPSTKAASTDTSATWKSTLGAVSVGVLGSDGTATATRQITGVAAGVKDTDAVNVAQLMAVAGNSSGGSSVHFFQVNSGTSGTNYNNDGAKGIDSIAIGKASTAADNSIAIGNGASVSDSNGGKGSGDIVIGNGAKINNYVDQSASIAIGQNAQIDNMAGMQEFMFGLGQTNYNIVDRPGGGMAFIPEDPSKVATGIAIGENIFVRTGGLMIGTHNYRGTLGDVDVDSANIRATGVNVNSTTLGTNSYNSGAFATIVGSYSIASGNYASGGDENNAGKNLGTTIVGSLNSVESSTAENTTSGVANSVVGFANRTFNSNGSLIFGAGNEITNSVSKIEGVDISLDGSAKDLQTGLIEGIKNANSGGSTLAIGGGNKADYTQQSALVGVNNTLEGTEDSVAQYNALTGFNNTATGVTNVTVTGSNNTVSGSTSIVNLGNENAVADSNNTILLGDNRTVTGSDNSVILGRANKETTTALRAAADTTLTTTADNVVVMGYNANATVDDGVALGSNSVASVNKGVDGYNPSTKELSGTAWTSTIGSVSVGDAANDITRQITGVAAGTADTDAVNVAQLKANKVTVTAGDNVTLTTTTGTDGSTDYKIASTDKNIYLTSAAFDNGTLTLTQTEGTPITVSGLATAAQVEANKIHYFQVNSAANGTNYNNNGATGTDAIAIGKSSTSGANSIAIGQSTTAANNSIAIGKASISDSNGKKGSGDIAIGNGANINNYVDQSGSIAIGQNAKIENMSGMQEYLFSMGQTTFTAGNWLGTLQIPNDPSKEATGIAIGENTYACTGSLMVGSHNYRGLLGDVTVDSADTKAQGVNINSTTLGTNSYNGGAFATITGAYSIASSNYNGGGFSSSAGKNFGATIMGSLNSIESATASNSSGIANSVVGVANRTFNSNGSLIFGTGNEITNSITTIAAPSSAGDSAKALQTTLMNSIKSSNSGGSTLAISGGNKADYTQQSALLGVNNTLTGASDNISQYNYITGFKNTGTNVDNVTIIGTNRTVSDAANSVVIGSADSVMTSSASDAVTIGRNANTTIDGGVALGSNSVASVDKGVDGYNPSTKALTGSTWTSTVGSVSVGDAANDITRQITGVAAGTQDTDAVNVAQLKANKVTLKQGENVTITTDVADDGATTYTIKSTDTNTVLAKGEVTYVGADGTLVLTDSDNNPITVTGLKNTYLTGASLENNTLTLTQNEGAPITVTGIATTAELAANKVKYFSVKSELAANQNNDGAKGTNSIAIGPNAVAQRENGIALGTNVYSGGKGSIVIGSDAKVSENIALDGSIVIGKGAVAFTGGGEQEALLGMDPTNWPKRGSGGYDNPTDASRVATSIVIGTNAFGRTGSIDIGDRVYRGTMGGKQITDNNTSFHVNQTTLGTNTYNKGLFSTMMGSYSIATGGFDGSGRLNTGAYGAQNFGATVLGSLNSVRSNEKLPEFFGVPIGSSYQGIANTIVGLGNITDNTNGSLVFGAGNKITNSITSISMPTSGADSVDAMVDKLQTVIKDSKSGGATLAIGGANTADYTRTSSIIGVNNTLKGTSSNISQFNALTGYHNTATNVDNVTVTGSNNTVKDTTTAVVIGDNRTLTGVNNNVVIGSADSALETTVSDAVAVGRNANVTIKGGVALGANSVARTDKGVVGYDPSGRITDADSILGSNTQYQSLQTEVTDAQTTVNDLTAKAAEYQANIDMIVSMYPDNSYEQDAGYQGIKASLESTQAQLATAQADLDSKQSALAEAGKALYTWQSTAGSVSVGDVSKGITRQITDVAAGTADTDAVNVAQLKQVAEAAEDAGKTTLNFTGDDTTATIARGNGQILNITGGATATDADGNSLLTDNNIGVVKDGDNALKVQLAKDLTGLNSVKVGNAVTLGTTGLIITNGPSVTTTGIDAGSKKITNVVAGTDDTDAVNVSQLNSAIKGAKHTEVTLNGDAPTAGANGALGEYIGSSNLTMAVQDVDGQKVYDLKMSKDLVAGTKPGADGKNGEAGSITIIGEPGKDGADGKNTSANITVKDGKNGLDGTDGITRIVYKDEDGTDHEIATMDDGLNFTGDTENVTIAKKLNETLSITGGITKADQLTTEDNIGVVASDSGLKVRLAKDLQDLNSVRIGGTTENGKGIYIANQSVSTSKGNAEEGTIASAEDALSLGSYANASKDTAVALGAYAKTDRGAGELFGYVPGLTGDELTKFQTDNAGSVIWNSNRGAVSVGIKGKETRQITNVAAGTEDTDAVNIAQLKAIDSKVDANKISYFSVNSSTESNKDNDGATGVESIAIGGGAKAKHYQSIAIGGFTEAANIDSIAIGYLASATEMADNGVSIGRETRNTVPNGIALGSYSVADRRENILSYDPLTETNFNFTPEMQTALDAWNAAAAVYYQNPTPENAQAAKDAGMKYRLMVAPWMAGMGSLSLGNGEEGLTRQITNVAAGTIDTDAVNIAQLKAAKVEVLAGTNISSIDKDTSAGYTQYKVNAKDTITDSATLSGDTITFTRNDGTTYKVSGLASTSALDTNKTRYFSVNSTDAGNRGNDGATGAGALAAGVNAKATKSADTAIGNGSSASGSWSIAAGAGSNASGTVAVAMGYGATAAANQSVAIGYSAKVTRNDSIAIGRETQANELNTVAIGLQTKANGNQSMALGYGALTERSANNGLAIGVSAYVGPIRSTDPVQGVPGNSTSVVDDDTVVEAGKEQMNSIALGNSAKAFGYQTTALGAGAEAHDTNSLAVGIMAIGKGNYATALGKQAYANGNEATALGHWARAYGDNAIAIGSYAITNTLDGTGTVNNGIAIGQKARVASNNSVALGQNSLAYIPDSVKTEAYLTNEAFAAENGVVSVGNAEYTIGDDTVAANRRRITNVAGGADDYDAVNVAQLKELSSKLTQEATNSKLSSGKNITINTTTDDNGVKTNTIDLNDKITLNNAAAPGQQVVVDGTTSNITAGTGNNQVVVNGSNGQVTIGAQGSQLTIGKQGDTAKDKEGNLINPDKTGHYITGLDNTTWKPETNGIVENRAATEGQLRDAVNNIGTQIGDINTDIEAIQNAKREFISDTEEKIEVGNAETLSITGGAMEPLTEGNIGVVNDGTKGFKVKLSSKLSGLERVTVGSGDTATVIGTDSVTTTELVTGNTTVNTDGVTIKTTDAAKSDIKLTSDTISMGKNQIHDVVAGEAETDAVNVGQLNSAVTNIGSNMNYLGNQINKLDNRVNRVGAGAAALAALHPLDYNPTTRWEFAAGVGNYKGANAVAVGAFYRPHSDMMFSLGSSFGGGENMVNAGVTWRVGAGQTTNYGSSQAMAQEIDSLRSVVNDQQSMIQSQNQKLDTQSAQLEEQKQRIEELTQLVNSLVNK